MHITDREGLLRQLHSLKIATVLLEDYLALPAEQHSEFCFDAVLANLTARAITTQHLMKKHRESLNLAVERRATQHVKALEAGAEALEIAAAKRYSEGDKAGAESSLNSAKLVREEIKKLIVKGRRASLKLVK